MALPLLRHPRQGVFEGGGGGKGGWVEGREKWEKK